jgi:predicted GNAT family acetyltransferase
MQELQLDIRNNTAQNRFEAEVDGLLAVSEYMNLKDKIVFTHTEVPTALEGRGIASQLAKAGLEFAREQGKVVVPICPYVAAYIRRHPEYRALVLPGFML